MKTENKKEKNKIAGLTKNKAVLIGVGILGLVSLIIGSFTGGKSAEKSTEYTDVGFYTEYLEERIKRLCMSVSGVTSAEVFLTIDCSSEYVYGEGGDYLILSGSDGEKAVLLCEIYPKVRGIAVVCTGGDQPRIREVLVSLLSAALDLSSSKIEIAGK